MVFPYIFTVPGVCMAQALIQVPVLQLATFFSSEITHSSDPLFLFLQYYAWQPVFLKAVIAFPSCFSVLSLAVNLSCPVVQTLLCWSSPCPMPKACHQFFPGFVALSCSVVIKDSSGWGCWCWNKVMGRSH